MNSAVNHISKENTSELKLDVFINSLIGSPFDITGKRGYNCYTLCQKVSEKLGNRLPEKSAIKELFARSNSFNEGKQDYIKIDKPERGDLVTFCLHPKYVTHIGIMIDSKCFIHIMKKRQVCIEKIDNIFWKKKLDGFYRYTNSSNT